MDYSVVPGRDSALTHFHGAELGAVDVYRHDGSGRRLGKRNPYHIRSNWVDDFVIAVPISARATTVQCGQVANLEPGSFGFLSTAKPFMAELSGAGPRGEFSAILARISGPLLRKHVPHIDDYCGLPVDARSGAGKAMQSLFEIAIAEGEALASHQYSSDMLFLSVANVAADVAKLAARPRPERLSSSTRLRKQAMEFIHCHLSDPELDSHRIAAHCRVSVRYLQMAFAAASMTAEAYIRESRLLQCRALLQHPDLAQCSVFQVALKWGFTEPAYFSRLYKTRFGLPPSRDRG